MLRVHLLGALEVELDGAVIDSPASQRPWAVFAYVALAGRPVSRAELAARFWPDVLDQSARASLRSALWAVRRRIGDAVLVDGERVSLPGAWVDAAEFERLADTDPARALELCRGDLLEGLDDEWAMLARQRHRERVIAVLECLAQAAEQGGDLAAAIALSRRQLERDPLDEGASRRLMIRLEHAGDRAGAARVFRTLSDRLRRELAVVPSAATRELAAQLQDRPATARPVAVAPPSSPRPPLVGRDRELAALVQGWERVLGGTATVAAVRAPPGLGKSRLCAELATRAHAAGGLLATGGGLDLGSLAPLSLWAEIVGQLIGHVAAPPAGASWPADLTMLGAELPEHFAQRGEAAPTIAPDLQRTRLFEAVVALLAWAARRAPVLLVLEDVHAADEPSLELAGYAARRLARLPVMVVLTRRPAPHHPGVDRLEHALRARGQLVCELDLGPLPDQAMARLVRTVARVPDHDLDGVLRAAEGNPLLALETVRALARGHMGVAPSLRALMRTALAPLSPESRELVEFLAVAGRPVAGDELPGREGAARALTDALQTGVVIDDNRGLRFGHALLREAAYEEIPASQRPLLHRRWAAVLESGSGAETIGRAAEIARQLRLAGADAEAAPHLARAAAQARDVGALTEAISYLQEALAIEGDPELWLELGELEAWRGERRPAENAFDTALALLAGRPELAQARAWLRRARAYHGPICVPRAVLECTTRALELLEGCGAPCASERSEALAARAWAEAVAGDVQEAERLLLELGREPHAGEDLRVYDTSHARALALMRRGRFREAYGPSIAAGDAILRADRPDLAYGCWANAAGAATAAGEPERALEFLERGMAAVAGRGLTTLEVHMLGARSFVLTLLGRLDEAAAATDTERALAEQAGRPELLAMASHDRGRVALARGDYTAAAELLAAAFVPGAPISRPLTRLALVEALARAGDPDSAAAELRETVLDPVRPSDFPAALVPRLARAQGLVAQARGDLVEARARFEEAVRGWQGLLARSMSAETMTAVLADLGRPVVGLIDPELELARVRADLGALPTDEPETRIDAVVP